MDVLSPLETRSTPLRLVPLSLAAMVLPVVALAAFPESVAPYRGVLWLVALVPPFLFAYYRGWRGAAAAAAVVLVLIVLARTGATLLGHRVAGGSSLPSAVAMYAGIAAAVGLLAEMLRRDRARAIQLALTDDLTGLPNRRFARWFLDKEFAAAERGRPVTVVLFDLDCFKRYNDRHGHSAGDAALREVARVLDRLTRRMNLSARYGGEEFLSILSSAEAKEALVFVERVREELRRTGVPAEPVTVSAGVATYHAGMRSPDELLSAADRAMYLAKRAGGDRAHVADAPAPTLAAM